MTQRGFPFDAGEGLTYELDWSKMARNWLTAGVIRGVGSELAVFADSSGMQVKVPTGDAWVRGHYYTNDAQVVLSISAAHPTLARIDRVVLRIDYSANTIRLAVLTGTAAASPAAPALTQTDSVYEYSLAQVAVAAGAGNLAAGTVTKESIYASGFQSPESTLTITNDGTQPSIRQTRTGAVTGNYDQVIGAQGVSNQYGLYNNVSARYEWYTSASGVLFAPQGISVAGGGVNVTAGGASIVGTVGITGATSITGTLTTSGTINGQTISGAASFTGTLTVANGQTVTAGGINVTGNSSVTGTLTVSSTLTVSASGASITGGLTVVTGGIVVSAGGINITGTSTFNNNITASGTINGQTISSAAAFTGSVTVATGLTVTASGLTITAGGLTVSAGGAAITGNSTVTGTLAVTSTINGQTISSSASFTGTVAVAGLLSANGGLSISTVTYSGTGNVFTTANAGTSAAYGTFVNTGGTAYFGIDNSAGTTLFNAGAYATGINAPANFVIRVNNSVTAFGINTTGIVSHNVALSVGTGTLPSTGSIRLSATSGRSINTTWNNGVTDIDINMLSSSGPTTILGDSNTGQGTTIRGQTGVVFDTTLVRPNANATTDLGSTSFRYSTIYAVNALNTSHPDYKRDIVSIQPGYLLNLARQTRQHMIEFNYKLAGEAGEWRHIGFDATKVDARLSMDGTHSDTAGVAATALGAVVDLEGELRAEIAQLRNRLAILEK